MVSKYRKKPVVIEAVQFSGNTTIGDIKNFVGDALGVDQQGDYYIKTLEGSMYFSWGHYIIKGVKGEFYPCEADIFEMTYDKAE